MRTLHLETEPVAVNLEVRAPEKRPCTPNRVFHHALPQIPGSAGKRKPRRPGRENRAHFSYASVAGLKFARHCAVFSCRTHGDSFHAREFNQLCCTRLTLFSPSPPYLGYGLPQLVTF